MSQSRRPVLGRGLSALIPGAAPDGAALDGAARTGIRTLALDQIRPARQQPRTAFDADRISALAASIGTDGLLQPIVVREVEVDRYEIVAGERRYRASKLAGLTSVPVVIREASDSEAYELALVENVQREDLGPLEEAEAYRYLADEHGMTQEQIAQRVGRDRATVSNALRLLKLPESVRDLVAAGALTAGHARAVLTAPEEAQVALATQAAADGWSVREAERQARVLKEGPVVVAGSEGPAEAGGGQAAGAEAGVGGGAKVAVSANRTAATEAVEAQLRAALGAPIKLVNKKGKGRIEIRFHSFDELERLIDLMSGLQGV